MISPRKVFGVDAAGAVLSALLLILLIAPHEDWFGLHPGVSYALAVPAVAIAAYSGSCYIFQPRRWRRQLRRIVLCNLMYCIALGTVLISYRAVITGLGLAYFIGECCVLALLIILELRTLKIHADA